MTCPHCHRELGPQKRRDPLRGFCSLYCRQEWEEQPEGEQLELELRWGDEEQRNA